MGVKNFICLLSLFVFVHFKISCSFCCLSTWLVARHASIGWSTRPRRRIVSKVIHLLYYCICMRVWVYMRHVVFIWLALKARFNAIGRSSFQLGKHFQPNFLSFARWKCLQEWNGGWMSDGWLLTFDCCAQLSLCLYNFGLPPMHNSFIETQ